MKKNKYNTSKAGFSLIEMAMVLIVIGLIIGGILKGQELIEAAKLKAVLTQLNEYRLATATFIDRYDGLPGDFDKADICLLPALKNGNRNGFIEGNGLSSESEAGQFWQHLAAAGLLISKEPPHAAIGGVISVTSNPYPDMPGHWFLLGKANQEKGNGALLSPLQAMSLDKRADNGDPKSGKIRAFDGEGGEDTCLKDGFYNLTYKKPACIVYFQF